MSYKQSNNDETRKIGNIKQVGTVNNDSSDEDWGPTIDFGTRQKYNIRQFGTVNNDTSDEDWGPTIDFNEKHKCNIKQYNKYKTSIFYTQSNLKDCDKAVLPEGLSYKEIDKILL
jgi:hypothetical protein